MTFEYDGSLVTKEKFYKALDFLVSIEPDPDDESLMEKSYKEIMAPYKGPAEKERWN